MDVKFGVAILEKDKKDPKEFYNLSSQN